jgi:hypothetical protein
MNYAAWFAQGLSYADFLARHATPDQQQRWGQVHRQVALTADQKALLGTFRRQVNVLCLAGAWCGDCVNQCPIFDHFAAAAPCIQVRFVDREAAPELTAALRICGGARVPVVLFLSEDFQFCGLYGDRTLSKYRQMAAEQLGAPLLAGPQTPVPLLTAEIAEWLAEFERIHWMLRLSPRLRQKHGD